MFLSPFGIMHKEVYYTPRLFLPSPLPPRNTSPVPWLTSLHSTVTRGDYGNSRYRGNCGGYLIKDLLRYFQPASVLDPMTGSGTCKDVCRELGIPCTSFDLHCGQDALDPPTYEELGTYDFVWLHPPYWRQIRYNDDSPSCLSNAATPDVFEKQLRQLYANCSNVLSQQGHMAVLMGDYIDYECGFAPLTFFSKRAAESAGFHQCCTDIIRFQHHNSSSRKKYRSSFIPGLHDVCSIFQKA